MAHFLVEGCTAGYVVPAASGTIARTGALAGARRSIPTRRISCSNPPPPTGALGPTHEHTTLLGHVLRGLRDRQAARCVTCPIRHAPFAPRVLRATAALRHVPVWCHDCERRCLSCVASNLTRGRRRDGGRARSGGRWSGGSSPRCHRRVTVVTSSPRCRRPRWCCSPRGHRPALRGRSNERGSAHASYGWRGLACTARPTCHSLWDATVNVYLYSYAMRSLLGRTPPFQKHSKTTC